MFRNLCAGIGLALVLAGAGAAQNSVPLSSPIQVPPQILTLDQERLFDGSNVAERISAEIEQRSLDLAAENRRIESELTAEELALTEQRPTMEPEAFQELADAFDAKVQRIRAEQDAKTRDLQRLREQERQNFLRQITPVLAEIVRERGAVAVLDRRSVFLSAESIDITAEAIERINAAFDEGPRDDDTVSPVPVPTPDSDDNAPNNDAPPPTDP